MSTGLSLDQLAKQASRRIDRERVTQVRGDQAAWFGCADIIREALGAATHAQREQLEQAFIEIERLKFVAQEWQESAHGAAQRIVEICQRHEQQLAQVTKERDAAICRATLAEEARDLWHERFSETLHQWTAQRKELETPKAAIAGAPPWHYVGVDDEERCFFCDASRWTCEHPSGNHAPGCVWEAAQPCPPTS